MNRNDEFTELMKELDGGVPEVGESIKKAGRRKARKQFLYQPFMGLVAVFMLFVLSVNISAPVATAFSKVPFLKDLTKAVAISKSVRDAIENDYVQEMQLSQTKDGVTVEIVATVVDSGKLSVFYRFESEKYKDLTANCSVFDENNRGEVGYTIYEMTDWNTPNDEVRCVSTEHLWSQDSVEMIMPEKVQFHMVVWDREAYRKNFQANVAAGGANVYNQTEGAENYRVTEFEFLLDLTAQKLPEPQCYELNQMLEIDGSKYTFTDIKVHPTYMRVGVKVDGDNTTRLENINFYVETEDGERFYSAVGPCMEERLDKDTPYIYYFDAESPYFSEAESLKLVVTSVACLDPEKDRTRINLTTGEVWNLPENVTLKQIDVKNGATYLKFEQLCEYRTEMQEDGILCTIIQTLSPFATSYYDAEGNENPIRDYGFAEDATVVKMPGVLVRDENGEATDIEKYTIQLNNYSYEEIYLETWYSDEWRAEEEVSFVIK